jgi:hypothetical protein
MPEFKQPPSRLPRRSTYDDELSSLPGMDDRAAGASRGADSMVSKIDEAIGQHHDSAAQSETNALASLNQGIAGIGEKLGKGFTGGAGGAAGAIYKSDNAFAGAGGKLKLIKAVTGSAVKNRKGLLAGGAGASALTILGVLFMGTLPFGFNSIMHNIIDHESKVMVSNMGEMEDNLASYYIKKYLMPGMKLNNCSGPIVDKSCAVKPQGSNPVSNMFKAWQKGNIEAKWAKQGFEIRYDRGAGRYFIRATGQGDIDITKYTGTKDNLFHEVNKSDVRALFQESHKASSKWDKMLTRFGWGKKTIKLNYDATRCVFTCKVLQATDKYFTQPWKDKKNGYKIKFAQKVLGPRSAMYELAFTCLFAGHDCDPNKAQTDDETGKRTTKFDDDIKAKMDALRATEVGNLELDKAQTAVKDLREKGFERYIVETIVKALLGKVGASEAVKQTTAKFAGAAVPGVNLVVGLASIISTLSTIGTTLKTTNSYIQTHSAALQFAMNSTYMDEVQSGNVDATEVGSFNDSFSSGQEVMADGKTMGGAGAGATPLYNAVVNDGGQTQTAFLNGLFGAKTYAADNDPNHTQAYQCPISKKILDPSGKDGNLICPEQTLKYATFVAGAFGSISDFLNLPGIKVITDAANLITDTVGDLFKPISQPIADAVQKLPGYDSMIKKVQDAADSIMENFADYIYPNWINSNPSGGTNFIATDFGGRVVFNNYMENEARGAPLTAKQQFSIESQQDTFDEINFKRRPLYARLFDKEDPHSFVVRLSLAMPLNFRSQMGSIVTGLISDPFGKLMRGFGAVFASQKAFAAPKILDDPFGLTHYGFPLDSAVFKDDPELTYDSSCSNKDHNIEWNSHVTENPDTGLPEHRQADACGILTEGTAYGGGLFDSKLVGL